MRLPEQSSSNAKFLELVVYKAVHPDFDVMGPWLGPGLRGCPHNFQTDPRKVDGSATRSRLELAHIISMGNP